MRRCSGGVSVGRARTLNGSRRSKSTALSSIRSSRRRFATGRGGRLTVGMIGPSVRFIVGFRSVAERHIFLNVSPSSWFDLGSTIDV
ncbi:hypothetical protein NFA_40210 [Nocardia farcinica IFM 10152]|uniref:Uncharacterized protein n=1 Tax=Nocardia farcinica (strain IFM 10152) TaxID=247156 RepID=Q5YSH2_NOCFA|nr:hypothetical protein NFA_40210 [Nocardia farcinica IFM 10152]